MYKTFSVSYIICFLFIVDFRSTFGGTLKEGDQCSFKDGTQGICRLITSCQPILEALQQYGIHPETENICGLVGTQSIVCCNDTGNVTKPSPASTKPTIRLIEAAVSNPQPASKLYVTLTSRTPGEISKQKCKEYAQYAYERIESPVSSNIHQYSNVLICTFDNTTRVVGGTLAKRFEFPHMALLGYQTGNEVKWVCGGSLISENFVLTAGHCLKNRGLGSVKFVRIGLTNLTDLANMQERTVSEIIRYPKYNSSTKYHDIGLLKMSKSFNMKTYARPACLQTEKTISCQNFIASGWGQIEHLGEYSNDLLKVVLELFDTEQCNYTYRKEISEPNSKLKDGIIEDLMICAGSKTEKKDTCPGDSGGPLQVYHENTEDIKCMYDIVGITSFGKPCGVAKNTPGVYTRVSAYLKWIEDTVWPQ